MRLNSVKLPSQFGILITIFVLSMASPGFAASVQAQVGVGDALAAGTNDAAPCFAGGVGHGDASASCLLNEALGATFSASSSAHAEYGHLSGSASVSVAGLWGSYVQAGESAFYAQSIAGFSDHLSVAGTGTATATIHFSGNRPGQFDVCAAGIPGYGSCGITTGSISIVFLAGSGLGGGFDLSGQLNFATDFGPGGLQGRSAASAGPVTGYLDITGIDITGTGVTGPITSESGAMYTADGVTSAPEPVLWPATALFLFVCHRSRSK